MLHQILTYVFYAIIAVFAIGTLIIIGLLLMSNRKQEQAKTAAAALPQQATIADQISDRYKDELPQQASGTGSFVGKQSVQRQPLTRREARSVFSFSNGDSESALDLNSDVGEQSNREKILGEDS